MTENFWLAIVCVLLFALYLQPIWYCIGQHCIGQPLQECRASGYSRHESPGKAEQSFRQHVERRELPPHPMADRLCVSAGERLLPSVQVCEYMHAFGIRNAKRYIFLTSPPRRPGPPYPCCNLYILRSRSSCVLINRFSSPFYKINQSSTLPQHTNYFCCTSYLLAKIS